MSPLTNRYLPAVCSITENGTDYLYWVISVPFDLLLAECPYMDSPSVASKLYLADMARPVRQHNAGGQHMSYKGIRHSHGR